LLDTHRPDAFAMLPFRPPAPSIAAEPAPLSSLQIALRMFRPNLEATVRVKQERPAEVAATGVRGTVLTASGPWRSAGEWWTETRWVRDAWDIDLSDGGVYRIYLRLDSRRWFIEGVYD
jgi:protein ImuB